MHAASSRQIHLTSLWNALRRRRRRSGCRCRRSSTVTHRDAHTRSSARNRLRPGHHIAR
eukprot:COSAG06_NODE_20055_length_811_cov_0.691011_1_plen_58_part_10